MSESGGLMESLKRMTSTLLVICQARLALLSSELEEERVRIAQTLIYSSVALFFFGFAIMLLTVFIVVVFWDNYRLLVLGGFVVLYFIAGLLVWNASLRLSREKSRLFSTSLSELAEDRNRLAP